MENGKWLGALVVLGCALAAEVRAACPRPSGTWNEQFMPIPVYLNQNLAGVVCAGSDCSSEGGVLLTTEAVLHSFFDAAGAQLRFERVLDDTIAPGAVVAGSIHVYGKTNCASGPVEVTWGDFTQDGRPDWGRIAFCSTYQGAPVTWWSYPATSSPAGGLSYHGYLASGIGQILGYRPNASCGSSEKSLMNMNAFNSNEAHQLYRDDVDAYQADFGLRARTVPFRELDAPEGWPFRNWLSHPAAVPPELAQSLSRVSACNGAPEASAYLSAPARTNPRLVRVFELHSGFPTLATTLAHTTQSHTATACQDGRNALVAWLGDYEPSTGRQRVYSAVTTDGFATAPTITIEASGSDRTRSPGIGAAYDPVTGHYVLAWRNDAGEIVTKVKTPGAPLKRYLRKTLPGMPPTYWRSSDSVSVACGRPRPGSDLGPDNCIVTWSGTSWDRWILWAAARVDLSAGPALVFSQVRLGPSFSSGSPAVAFWDSPSEPRTHVWELLYLQGDSSARSCRKDAAATSWADCITVPWTGFLTTPTLASVVDCAGPAACLAIDDPDLRLFALTGRSTTP